MIGTNLFMAVCMWIFLPIVYVSMRNNTVCKNNLILSVTLPPEAQSDREVMEYCESFKRRLLKVCVILTAAIVPAIFLPWFSVSAFWSMTWLLVAMFVIMRAYGKGYEGLKKIKNRRGWKIATAGQTVVDLKPMKLPKRLKTGWFVPPMILSVLPVISCLADNWEGAWSKILAMTAGTNLMITAMSLVFYGLIFRQRKDILDADTETTAALTRVRRHYWTKTWLMMSWLTAFYSLAVWISQGSGNWYMIWTLVYGLVLVVFTVYTEFATRYAQQRLTQGRNVQPIVDEDDYWIWGQFYYNPNSRKLMINERVGMGMSMNMAHPAGKVMAVLAVLLLLTMPVLGGWLMVEELIPVTMEVTEETLTVTRVGTTYEIELNEIEQVQLLEKLPPSVRVWGTGMPNLLKGSFSVEGYGMCELCVNPEAPPFLLVETTKKTYILGAENVEEIASLLQP